MSGYLRDVAIIGAGLGGCALALSLSSHNVPVTIYESRPEHSDIFASGVVLTPNGLRILDRLGVLARIKDRCYLTTHRVFKNDKDETLKKIFIADEKKYGYCNHRVWRKVVLDEMRLMLHERGLAIRYSSKLNAIVSSDDRGVTFTINGTDRTASLLIGSDGINSTVRRYIAPNIVPEYTGTTALLAHIKRDSVHWPYPDYDKNATIQGKPAALFFIPEDPKAEDIMIGMQIQHPEPSREDLTSLQNDKDKLVSFWRKGYQDHGPTAKSIIDEITKNKESCFIWPFMRMPRLQSWFSDDGRVIIVGDGCHALPASSGQGVNQALEDVHSLTLLLTVMDQRQDQSAKNTSQSMTEALSFWQSLRQDRIDEVFDWATNTTNVTRLPEDQRQKLIAEGKIKSHQSDDMSWLYEPDLEDNVRSWLEDRRVHIQSE